MPTPTRGSDNGSARARRPHEMITGPSTVIASAAKQSIEQHAAPWIASSQVLLAMTETAIDRHPEVAASSAALEGRRPGSILRGSPKRLAPQDDDCCATPHQSETQRRNP